MFQRLTFSIVLLASTAYGSLALAQETGPYQIFVSKADQTLTVYDGEEVIATSKVSTGKPGHTTPSGIFSILEKRRYHESNLYSNAPMPFMQRLTWSGIALHEGKLPGYPASHGCVRLPEGFAQSLFSMTQRGVHVIVTDEPVVPREIRHDLLFVPRLPVPDGQLLSDVELRPTTMDASLKPLEVAMAEVAPKAGAEARLEIADEPPLRILITRRTERDQIMDVQAALNELGFNAGPVDGLMGKQTIAAIRKFRADKDIANEGALLSEAFVSALYGATGKERPPLGQILVRQKFKPLFQGDVTIREPERPLGTHFFKATDVDRYKSNVTWVGVTLEDHLSEPMRTRLGITADETGTSPDITKVMDRIAIPDDLRARIEASLSEGSSLTISDRGIGPETTDGTDFITVTKARPKG